MAQEINSSKIGSKKYMLLLKRIGESIYRPIMCEMTCSIERDKETKENPTKEGIDMNISNQKVKIKFDGQVIYGLSNIIKIKEVHDLMSRGDEVFMRIAPMQNNAENMLYYSTSGQIISIGDGFGDKEKAKTSITFNITEFDYDEFSRFISDGNNKLLTSNGSDLII